MGESATLPFVPPLISLQEDPFEDMRYLNLTKDDSMLIITSAGDNALHYAVKAQPKRIHCVDMNPW